jgi:hypothetical protein
MSAILLTVQQKVFTSVSGRMQPLINTHRIFKEEMDPTCLRLMSQTDYGFLSIE